MFQIKNRINKSVRLCRNSKIYKINVKTCFTCSFKFLLPHVYNLLFKVFLIEELKSYFKYLLWQVKRAQPCEALRLDWSQTHYLIWFTVILLIFYYITCMALIILWLHHLCCFAVLWNCNSHIFQRYFELLYFWKKELSFTTFNFKAKRCIRDFSLKWR